MAAKRGHKTGDHNHKKADEIDVRHKQRIANQKLIEFLAKQFKVSKGQVSILQGELARQKTLRIEAPRALPLQAGIVKTSVSGI